MNYDNMTYEIILQRMLDRIPDEFDKREGSIIYDALAPAAIELTIMYIEFNTIINESYADTATRDNLIKRVAERGLSPYKATNAILKGIFTPTTLEIPIGSRFSCENLNYEVISKIKDGEYQLKCEELGVQGNKMFGTLIPIDYINGLESASIDSVLIPGEDEEDTEELRQRYFSSFSNNAFGGNKSDYIQKTNAIAGVGATKVTPIWNGGGTVLLTILDSEFNKASETLIGQVQQVIDPSNDANGIGLAPIGHIVTVNSADEVKISISAEIAFDGDVSFSVKKAEIESAINEYLLEIRKKWAENDEQILRISQIENKIINISGIADIQNTKINGEQSNLTLTKYQIPVFESVIQE